ncbi:transposase [Streptomyces sp. NPDC054874]
MPGRPYSIVAAPGTGRTSWTAVLDSVRLQPGADLAALITAQIREVVERLIEAGQWTGGDPQILVVLDSGHDAPPIAHLPAGPAGAGPRSAPLRPRDAPPDIATGPRPRGGRPLQHGGEFVFGDPVTRGSSRP